MITFKSHASDGSSYQVYEDDTLIGHIRRQTGLNGDKFIAVIDVSGKEKFSDYLLGLVDEGDATSLQLVALKETAPRFKNTMLDVIKEQPVTDTIPELLVEWHESNKVWNFFLSIDGQTELPSPKA